MLDQSPQSLVTWVEQHSGLLGFLFTVVVAVAGWVVALARYGWRISAAEKDIKAVAERVTTVEDDLCVHVSDTRRHIDPERDERRWQDLMTHLQRIEDKVDRRR